jgi:hypothetical protein
MKNKFRIRRILESIEENNFEDIKLAFSDISDENGVSFYYGADIYEVYTDTFSLFSNYQMYKHVLISIKSMNKYPEGINSLSNIKEYYTYLDHESKIHKSIHESLLKCEFEQVVIKRLYQEILICITLT